MGNKRISSYVKKAIFGVYLLAVIIGFLQINPAYLPTIGEPTAVYDCDDETLDMYRHFQNLGLDCTPVVGNLEMNGETYTESNHIWLLVESGDKLTAYDWGTPRYDKQHYEGYIVSYDYLMYAVEQDKKNPALLGLAASENTP